MVRFVEVRIVTTHLCLINALNHCLFLIRGLLLLLLIRGLLLGCKGYTYHQQSHE